MIVVRTNPIDSEKEIDCFVEVLQVDEIIDHASDLRDSHILTHAKRTHGTSSTSDRLPVRTDLSVIQVKPA